MGNSILIMIDIVIIAVAAVAITIVADIIQLDGLEGINDVCCPIQFEKKKRRLDCSIGVFV